MDPTPHPSDDPSLDFAALLDESFEQFEEVSQGDLLTGTVVEVTESGVIIDLGLKRDGVVQRSEVEALVADGSIAVGDRLTVMVVNTEDDEGSLVVSVEQALASRDWDRAHRQMESGDLITARVIDANRGGLIVQYGELRGFVPASHVVGLPRGLDEDARIASLESFTGRELEMKVIEVNARRRRLVLSQRLAQRDSREDAKKRLLEELSVGDVVTGIVSSLRDFGAFVDLGGADGLIHVSELAWHRVHHPSEIVKPGDQIETYVLQLDAEQQRIGLSLKRLQPNPWEDIARDYGIGELVEGSVSRVVSFGAFVELDNGIEALLHISELGEPQPQRVEDVLTPGDHVVARIINLEPRRQRMGLSIKDLSEEERQAHASQHNGTHDAESESSEETSPAEEPVAEADAV